jgi:uncharacterized DUF497 family protein
MGFEWDADKSRSNREKHGIDFDRARELWQDIDRIEIPARDQDQDEVSSYRQDRGKTLVGRDYLSG